MEDPKAGLQWECGYIWEPLMKNLSSWNRTKTKRRIALLHWIQDIIKSMSSVFITSKMFSTDHLKQESL